jgi:cation diffusion facilitator CzcD-associated flavoprotein CzcO
MEKADRDYTDEERAALRKPWHHFRLRLKHRWPAEKAQWRAAVYRPGSKYNQLREAYCRSYIDRVFADRPDLREAVTPNHPFAGKRPIQASGFYPALLRDNVELVPRAVVSVGEKSITDADGVERQVDVLVMSTGFQAANYLARLRVIGRDGKSLHDVWAGDPYAFLGMTVPDFPNFFILYGPNTNGGEIVKQHEVQAAHAVRVAKRLRRRFVTSVEVKASWCERYNAFIQKALENTSFHRTTTYFASASGRIVTQWPYSATFYALLVKLLGRPSETARRLP